LAKNPKNGLMHQSHEANILIINESKNSQEEQALILYLRILSKEYGIHDVLFKGA